MSLQEREEISELLESRNWFWATSPQLREKLLELPEKFNGFLGDLAKRPDEIGGLKVLKLVKLVHDFGLKPVFRVRNPEGVEFDYEYVSWQQGPNSGAKGIVFVRRGEEITHFIVLRGDKFAPGKMVWDTVGGFIEEVDAKNVDLLLSNVRREIHEELGVQDINVEDQDVTLLGRILTDAGMTNNNPMLFAVVIDASEADKIPPEPKNLDQFELKAGVHVLPLSQLKELIKVNGDSFFLGAVLRSMAEGIISPTLLMR